MSGQEAISKRQLVGTDSSNSLRSTIQSFYFSTFWRIAYGRWCFGFCRLDQLRRFGLKVRLFE
jgi:hypothetical protein